MDTMICTLPGGYVDEVGTVHREAELTLLTGREEELLAAAGSRPGASTVTVLLARRLRRLGSLSPVSEEEVRRLLVGDRQYLLLKLRQATFGDRVEATLPCPWAGCGERVDIDFSIGAIPIVESKDKGPTYSLKLSPEATFKGGEGQEEREVLFRLPNGQDQEIISPLLFDNEARALSLLLARCVLAIGSVRDPDGEMIAQLSPAARLEIERRMEAVAPQVVLSMDARCLECGRRFEAPFELQDFFFGELRTSRDLLYREVHYLAYHYHWSEGEILSMPRDKRRQYIEVLADEIEKLNHAIA